MRSGVQLLLFLVSFFFNVDVCQLVMDVKIGQFTLGFILLELIQLEDYSIYFKIIIVRIRLLLIGVSFSLNMMSYKI
jgi:hypothetical protein